MSKENLRGLPRRASVEPAVLEALVEAVRLVVREELEAERPRGRAWLTIRDLQMLTGFKRGKIDALRKSGDLPMFRAPGSNEWRMTWAAFEAWERRVVEQGMPTEAKYRRRR